MNTQTIRFLKTVDCNFFFARDERCGLKLFRQGTILENVNVESLGHWSNIHFDDGDYIADINTNAFEVVIPAPEKEYKL